ncbi:MAG: hypothetical protein KC496_03255 [Anaerolineae bacterium]|nr:hypothetical protein [Anaerolineae bacterium]
MGIELYWDDTEQTVMLAEFSGKWSWDDLYDMLHTIKKLSVERGQIFGAIIDLRQGLQLPGGSVFNRDGLAQFRRLLSLNQGDNGKGPVAVVGMNGVVRSIFDAVNTFDRSLTDDVTFANSLDDARSKLYPQVARINGQRRTTSA